MLQQPVCCVKDVVDVGSREPRLDDKSLDAAHLSAFHATVTVRCYTCKTVVVGSARLRLTIAISPSQRSSGGFHKGSPNLGLVLT